MRVAAYRILYGHDFLAASLDSIVGSVDRICIFWQPDVWRPAKSKPHEWPADLRSQVMDLQDKSYTTAMDWQKRRSVQLHHWNPKVNEGIGTRPDTDMGGMVSVIQGKWPDVSSVLFVEPDEVWSRSLLKEVVGCAEVRYNVNVVVRRRDYWHSTSHWIDPPNPHWSLKAINVAGKRQLGQTAFDGTEHKATKARIDTGCLAHFAYAQSPEVVRVKHEICQWLENTPQHADWYEHVWKPWTWETGQRANLCPVVGHEEALAMVKPADPAQLPEVLR